MSPRNSHDAAAAAGLLKEPRDSLDALDSLDDVKPEPMDIESEAGRPHDANGNGKNLDHEYSVPSTVKFAWLGTYFFFSLALTLYNKAVLGMFHFPWLLTFLHASFASVGTLSMNQLGYFRLSHLGRREHIALVLFSVLFTANIAISNKSLEMVSVPFYQTMRMLCPLFTIFIYRVWYERTYSYMTYASLVPLVIGAAMTTIGDGDLSFSDAGFILTILGVILAALKTVVTNRFMTGSLALPPLEFLMRMSPLAALQALACGAATGELSGFWTLMTSGEISVLPAVASLTGNGFLAFLLNISSFNTNKLAGALTMTVCGNLKQCLTVGLGIFLFDVTVRALNGAGMAVTMVGAAIYSKAELDNKKRKAQQQAAEYQPVEQTVR